MSLRQTVYFMTLVGGLAGLVCWCLVVWIPGTFHLAQESSWIAGLVNLTILGGLIGGFTVGFTDHWSGEQVVGRWVTTGVVVGLMAGGIGGLVQAAIGSALGSRVPMSSRVLSWMIAGALIGFATGLRWLPSNKSRVVHAMIGGLFGGSIGGIAFIFLGSGVPDLPLALGFMVTGIGITCGVTLAPVLLRDGILRFISSGDLRAQEKYGPSHKEWELHDGGHYIVGSLQAKDTRTTFSQEVYVYLPDQMVAARHAVLSGRKGRFYVGLHP